MGRFKQLKWRCCVVLLFPFFSSFLLIVLRVGQQRRGTHRGVDNTLISLCEVFHLWCHRLDETFDVVFFSFLSYITIFYYYLTVVSKKEKKKRILCRKCVAFDGGHSGGLFIVSRARPPAVRIEICERGTHTHHPLLHLKFRSLPARLVNIIFPTNDDDEEDSSTAAVIIRVNEIIKQLFDFSSNFLFFL